MKYTDYYNYLNESFFHVPLSAYKQIYDYVSEVIQKTRIDKKISKRELEKYSKSFTLNLKNTQWEFLQPHTKPLFVNFILGSNSYYQPNHREWYSEIVLNLNSDNLLVNVLEHEILHHIQYSLRQYRSRKYKNLNHSNHSVEGGTPPVKYMTPGVDRYGMKPPVAPYFKRNDFVDHYKRPIEYYPNLLSMIRDLQIQYIKEVESWYSGHELEEKIKTIENDVENKKWFFNHAIVKHPELYRHTNFMYHIDNFKKLGSEHFKHIIKIAYNAFVNKPFNFDSLQIRKLQAKIAEKNKKKEKKFNFHKDFLCIDGFEDIFKNVDPDIASIEEGFSDTTFRIFYVLKLKQNKDSDYNLPKGESAIKKLFNNLKSLKIDGKIFSLELKDGYVTKEITDHIYDSIFELLKEKYMKAIYPTTMKQELEMLINNAYK